MKSTSQRKRSKPEKTTVRLNFEFPLSEYPYLKMVCASKGLSLKDFATDTLIKAIDEVEDELLARKANARLNRLKQADVIPWDDATRLAGWKDEEL